MKYVVVGRVVFREGFRRFKNMWVKSKKGSAGRGERNRNFRYSR